MQHRATIDTDRRLAAMAAHPAGLTSATATAAGRADAAPRPSPDRASSGDSTDPESGSLVTEYGLLAVVAATVAGVVIQWASGGALVTLFNALLRHARSLVGA